MEDMKLIKTGDNLSFVVNKEIDGKTVCKTVIFNSPEEFMEKLVEHTRKESQFELEKINGAIKEALKIVDKQMLVKYMWVGCRADGLTDEALDKLQEIKVDSTNNSMLDNECELEDLLFLIYEYFFKNGIYKEMVEERYKELIPNLETVGNKDFFEKVEKNSEENTWEDGEVYYLFKDKELCEVLNLRWFKIMLTEEEKEQAEKELRTIKTLEECPTYQKLLIRIIDTMLEMQGT